MNKRQAVFLLAKICFAAAVIWWLFHSLDPSHVWRCVRDAHRLPVIFAFGLCLITVAIAGWRWYRLLGAFDIEIRLRSLICIAQIGQFFAIFLPGPIGDDLTRMLYISRLAKGRVGEACTTVVIDRLIGLGSILVLAVACIPAQWSLLATSRKTFWLAFAIVTAGIVAILFGALFFLAGAPTHRWFERRLRSLPAHNMRDEVARIWGLLCDNKRAVAQVIGAAISTQFLLCLLFWLAGSAVGVHLPLRTWLGFVPIVLAANAVPITVAGIGVREYLIVLFLGVLAHVDGELALATSLIVFAVILAVCLFGGLVYIFYRPKRDDRQQEIKEQAAVR